MESQAGLSQAGRRSLPGQFYNNLRPLHDDPGNAEIDKASLLVLLRQWFSEWLDHIQRFEGLDEPFFNLDRGNPAKGAGLGLPSLDEKPADVIAVSNAFLGGIGRRHPVAAIVEKLADQQGSVCRSLNVADLGIGAQLGLNGIKEVL